MEHRALSVEYRAFLKEFRAIWGSPAQLSGERIDHGLASICAARLEESKETYCNTQCNTQCNTLCNTLQHNVSLGINLCG